MPSAPATTTPVNFGALKMQPPGTAFPAAAPKPAQLPQGSSNGQLDDASRAKLDSIVMQMASQNAPQEDVQAVVNDFKQKYTQPAAALPTPSPTAGGMTGAFGGLSKGAQDLGNDWGGKIADTFKAGVDQVKSNFAAPSASNPLMRPVENVERALGVGAGVATAITSPLAPVMAPIGKIVGDIGNKITDIPAVQKFATSKAGEATSRVAEDVQNASVIAGAVAGAKTPVGKEAPTSLPKTAVESPLVGKRLTELQKLEDNSAVIRKSTTKAKEKGIDSKKILAQTDLLHNAVDDTGTLRTQNAIHELNNFIKPHEDVISANLEREGVQIPLASVQKSLTAAIDKSGLEGHALEAAYTKLEGEMKGLSRRADENGNIKLAKIQDAKVNKYATLDYMNPGSKIADKAIARTYKTIIENNTKSVDVAALNKELAQHYSVLSLLEKLDGRKVDGGKLGKYFAKTIGSVVGSHFGPLGSIAGAEIAGRIKGNSMSATFNGKTGAKMSQSPAMAKAVEQGKQPPLMLPPGKGSGFGNKSINVPIPMREGFSMEKQAPQSSNSSGSLNKPQTTQITATSIPTNIADTVPQAAKTAIEGHLTSAQQVLDNLSPEQVNSNGGMPALLERAKTNIADGLAAQGFKDIAAHIRNLATSSFKSLQEFTTALWEHLKSIPRGERGFIKNPFGGPKKISSDDISVMKDFTDYVAGGYKPGPNAAKQLELDASRLWERHLPNKPMPKSTKGIAHGFGRFLDTQ